MNIPFAYHRCTSTEEALSLLKQPGAIPFAGGTDILVAVREGKLRPKLLVDLKHIPELLEIGWVDGFLRIGACTTINGLADNHELISHFPVLNSATRQFACYELRNRATIGGNIANAAPCAQTAPPLSVLEAKVEIAGVSGRRQVPFQDFITGVSSTILAGGELITAFLLPKQPPDSKGLALRIARVEGMDLASVHLAVQVRYSSDVDQREVRFCFGSVTAQPLRFRDLENNLSHKPITPELVSEVGGEVEKRIAPRKSSLRATPFYKKAMTSVLLADALARLLNEPAPAGNQEESTW